MAEPNVFKGSVLALANLPADENTVGDTYYVSSLTSIYRWDGTSWVRDNPTLEESFTPTFQELVALYRGIDQVWIEDDGALYAEWVDGRKNYIGPVSGYWYYVDQCQKADPPITPKSFSEWVQMLLDASVNAQAAEDAAAEAAESAQDASESATDATTQATTAGTYAQAASDSADTATAQAEAAATSAENASDSAAAAADSAESIEGIESRLNDLEERVNDQAETVSDNVDTVLGYKTDAETAAQSAENSSTDAETARTLSEAWAVGQIYGEDVPAGHQTYQNNAKYYSEQSAASANEADQRASDSQESSISSEAWAAGSKNGIVISDTSDPNYHNNSLWYSGTAEAWAKGTRNGTEVSAGQDGYQDNALWYKNQTDMLYQQTAEAQADVQANRNDVANIYDSVQIVEENVSDMSSTVIANTQNALNYSLNAEEWAVGTRNGIQTSTDNAKQWSSVSQSYALNAEAYAVGTRNGSAVETDVSAKKYAADAQNYQSLAERAKNSIQNPSIETYYATSGSGRNIPTAGWQAEINPVSGQYVWAKTIITWNDSAVSTIYNVSYIGVNGDGSVNSVNGFGGDVTLDATDITMDKDDEAPQTISDRINSIMQDFTVITNAQIDALFA